MPAANASSDEERSTLQLLDRGQELCRKAQRSDLAQSLETATARLRRPATVICVVGEFKQGKSHVVNALVGQNVCLVDDDLATTSITVVGYGPEPTAVVHQNDNRGRSTTAIDFADLPTFVAEGRGGQIEDGVEYVEVAVPSRILERGVTVVDTPGVNSLRTGYDAAVLDFLAYADGLVLVTDASAELTPEELRFASAAKDVCPFVLVALSKIDLYPEWRRIAELDRDHLEAVGLSEALVPISSTLRSAGLSNNDRQLNEESGYPVFLTALATGVLEPARANANNRARADLTKVLDALRETYTASLSSVEDPARAEDQLHELRRAQEGVARLQQASAKWAVALNDGFADLRGSVDYQVRTTIRRYLQETDSALATGDVKAAWGEVTDSLRASLAMEATEVFATVRAGSDAIAVQVGAMIAEEFPTQGSQDTGIDIQSIWESTDRELRATGPSMVTSGLSVLRGGYSGMLMLGMLGQLAGITALGPLTIGIGAAFGIKQLRDERKRQQERLKHEARNVVRQFLDQVQLELSTAAQRAVQDAHRLERDYYADRIRELSAAYSRASQVLSEAVASDKKKRLGIAEQIREFLHEVDQVAAEVEGPQVNE